MSVFACAGCDAVLTAPLSRVALPVHAHQRWTYLAFHHERRPVPGAGAIPDDDLPPLLPNQPFRPDSGVFQTTLARLPEVRQPWLREMYDRVARHPYGRPF